MGPAGFGGLTPEASAPLRRVAPFATPPSSFRGSPYHSPRARRRARANPSRGVRVPGRGPIVPCPEKRRAPSRVSSLCECGRAGVPGWCGWAAGLRCRVDFECLGLKPTRLPSGDLLSNFGSLGGKRWPGRMHLSRSAGSRPSARCPSASRPELRALGGGRGRRWLALGKKGARWGRGPLWEAERSAGRQCSGGAARWPQCPRGTSGSRDHCCLH